MSDKKKEDDKKKDTMKEIVMIVPECCLKGWDSCVHRIKKDIIKKNKHNIAL